MLQDVHRETGSWLVVTGTYWNMAFMNFHSVGNFIIPTDELIFFRGVGQPPTRKDPPEVLNDSSF